MTDDQKIMYFVEPEEQPRDMTPDEVLRQANMIRQALGM